MGYIRYEPEPGKTVEFNDISINYDEELDAFVFEVPDPKSSRNRAIPREKVFAVEFDDDER
jgi:hypothetical protein